MDSLDWVQYRLMDWAAWSMEGFAGGYPSRSPFVIERIQNGHGYIEVTPEIELTDKAVARVRNDKFWQYLVIRKAYLGKLGIKELAVAFRKSEDVARQMLWAAESAVGRHILVLERPQENVVLLAS